MILLNLHFVKHKSMKFFGITFLLFLPLCLAAQQPATPEEQEKQFREALDSQIEDYTSLLDLEYWQVFYVDSIMTHDYTAMRDEIQALSDAKVSNTDAYSRVQDKWAEQIYQSFKKVFTEEQWNKYLKSGAQREKKSRDKREAKRTQ